MHTEYHFGQDHIDIAYTLTNLGILYRKKKRLDDAEKVYKKYGKWYTFIFFWRVFITPAPKASFQG